MSEKQRTTRNRAKAVVALAVAVMTLGVGVSQAAILEAHRSGAYVFTNDARTSITVRDTAADSQSAHGDWRSNYGSGGRVSATGGASTQVTKTVVTSPEVLTQVRACRSNTATPVSCDGWNNGKG